MKRLAATAITLLMTAAIGTAAASPFDHGDNRQGSGHGYYNRGTDNRNTNVRYDNRNANVRNYSGNSDSRRWEGRDHDGRGNAYSYRYDRGYDGYSGYNGYRDYYPGVVSVAYVGGQAPYYAAPYAYDNGPYAYGNGYVACDSRVRHDNTGGKILGAVIGGVIGNQFGRGDGRQVATVAGAAIGYGIAASADNDRRYEDCGYY